MNQLSAYLLFAVALAPFAPAPLAGAAETAPFSLESFSVPAGSKKGFTLPEGVPAAQFNREATAYMSLPPGQVKAHPDAARFPGVVPADVKARVTRTLDFSTGVGRWQSTGLYANAGETVVVTAEKPLPAGVTVHVRIGCHTDRLPFNEKRVALKRFPIVSRDFKLTDGATPVANAFGGNVFVEVRGADKEAAPVAFKLTFANAVEAPFFRLGTDSAEAWEKIRNAPAPWAELVGRKMILHVPSSQIREMKDPSAVLEWWDKVLTAEDELVGWPERNVHERVVPDIQISAGWMHSGYPFMCQLPVVKSITDLEKLRTEGEWGFFHELGHNHQSKDWTFAGQGEVTVNFFSLYCMETIVGRPRGAGHNSMKNLGKLLDERLATPPQKDNWQQLAPFVALIRRYDWPALRSTLSSYQTKPNPKGLSEPQRQAEFVARYSEFAKANLGSFFAKLGYDVTGVAERAKDLPVFDYEAFRATLEPKPLLTEAK